ncbi:barstar family protein [Streptomyces xiaopingdaonensis]|uniref:barstar family protein n=1 Tax=Streptomyces xiaopingdaonensis TaxID=1565415 RepID=UPI0002F3785D|nr:barstar family protein [Streptomyces xiaopingdaonensis]
MTSSVDLPHLPYQDLPGVFDGSVPAGVYRCPGVGPDALMHAEAAGWIGAVADLTGVTDKAGFMEAFAVGLELPGYFGRNWDALSDCLTDLSWWGETEGYLLLTAGWAGFEQAAPAEADSAAGVLSAAAGYWAVRETPLTVLLG